MITIGILGAFALNNWNENRKESRLLVNQLIKISEDLANDRLELEELQEIRSKASKGINQLVIDLENQDTISTML